MSKLFKKTLIIIIVLFALISISTSLISGWYLNKGMVEEFSEKSRSIARIISESSVSPLLNNNPVTLQSMIDEYLSIVGIAYILIVDSNKTVIAHTFVPGVPSEVSDMVMSVTENPILFGDQSGSVEYIHLGISGTVVAPIVGGVAGYVFVGMDEQIVKDNIYSIILRQQALILLLLILSVFISYFLIERISRPLTVLSNHARRLASTDIEKLGQISDEIKRVADKSDDEIGALAQSFIKMEKQLKLSIQNLESSVAARERMETELMVAADIHLRMLPDQASLSAINQWIAVETEIDPAREVGGDFFDCFFLDLNEQNGITKSPKKLFFTVGDVSGKGVPAALFMSMTCTLIKTRASINLTPQQLMTWVNLQLCKNNESCMFVTVFCGVLDIESGHLVYCSAGHNPPYLLCENTEPILLKSEPVMPLGVFEEAKYTDNEMVLSPKDSLFLYTDGVTEATDSGLAFYGERRLETLLMDHRDSAPFQLIEATKESIESFVKEADQADDITLMAIQFTGVKIQSKSIEASK